MPASFESLPIELQEQILNHLYQPWHLETKDVPTFNRTTIYTFVATTTLGAAPLRACKALRKVALRLLEQRFSGVLDASNTRHDEHHSIMPKYKIFLPRINRLVLGSFGSLATMGGIYQQRLPGLKAIEVAPADKLLMLHAQLEAFALSPEHKEDDLYVHQVNTYWHYWIHFNEFVRNCKGVTIFLRQEFEIPNPGKNVSLLFNISEKPVRIVRDEDFLGSDLQSDQ